MLSRLYSLAESVIKPFVPPPAPPAAGLAAFFFSVLRQVWAPVAVMMVTGLAVTLLEVQVYRYGAEIVDMIAGEARDGFLARHGARLIFMALVAGLALPLAVVCDEVIKRQTVTPSLTMLTRWQSFHHVIRQSLGFFVNEFAGLVANRIMQLGPAARETLIKLLDNIWYVSIYAISSIVLFVAADWRLAVPLLVWLAAYGALMRIFVPPLLATSEHASERRSIVTGRVVDAFTNIQTVKLFSHAAREDAYALQGMRDLHRAFSDEQRVITSMVVAVGVINMLFLVAATGLAVVLWSDGRVTIGALSLVFGLALRLTGMSQWIMWEVTAIFDSIGTVQESLKSIAPPHLVVDAPDARPLSLVAGEIRFEAVRFHYGKESGGLDGIDLVIRPGEKIGLVGPSGAGKSTLVSVFLRLYDLAGGRILVDGQDIAGVTQESLRARVGVVTQDTSLMHRSVRDNIKYGREEASDEEMIRAARMAHAEEFIATLEDGRHRRGFEAHVGERGVKLSGGQRQRIAIARVLLKNAPILILDEATSALDSDAEAAIQESLVDLMKGKTVIAIAHRLSTIARMDRLVVMDKGRLVEIGSHAGLIGQGGLYARLWQRQTGGFIADDDAGT